MENEESKFNVGCVSVTYDWEINSVPVLNVKFEIINLDPKIDPTESGDYLCKALKEYLEIKNS